ncbi:Oidioi.mRNA.OKI2018_I69.XSR.g16113.t1.cds [Oikopleura dioica]|uniref:Beta-galactosidase n=1 Tax=Oikopleura dioica TaxID=34765 RepID=A0ABN7SJ28_OIKDI|nr:Oidioi.mRNA.OKI2018_I69.XSR.g16113.t1.cds [Oikopleura dioica]
MAPRPLSLLKLLAFFVILSVLYTGYIFKSLTFRRRSSLSYDSKNFYLGEEASQLLSGSVHYFRIPKKYWHDRLAKVKSAGLNGVTTYVPWNLHEPEPGEFHFSGDLDLVHFINVARALDLFVILRPGPYICSELEWGGLPAWLLRDSFMKVRTNYPGYISAVKRYFAELLPLVKYQQSKYGGPIIAVQVENEYGLYAGQDPNHLNTLAGLLKNEGIVEPLFTSDGSSVWESEKSTIYEDGLKSVNFKSNPEKHLKLLRGHFPDQPLWVMEYWAGWFDWWGEGRNLFDTSEFTRNLDIILDQKASVNFYMFHGGTNFGFTNGGLTIARGYYTADVTSYDYDCPISESGAYGEKFYAIRESLVSHGFPVPEVYRSSITKPRSYKPLEYKDGFFSLWDMLHLVENATLNEPMPMEIVSYPNAIGQSYGYIFYEMNVDCAKSGDVVVSGLKTRLRGRAHFYLNRNEVGKPILYEDEASTQQDSSSWEVIHSSEMSFDLGILVENPGRVNFDNIYGLDGQYKGLLGNIVLSGSAGCKFKGQGVSAFRLDMNSTTIAQSTRRTGRWRERPGLHKFTLHLRHEAHDTFVDPVSSGFRKGVVFVNERNLGRYWEIGPQKTLYLPGPWLRSGANEIIVFDEYPQQEAPKVLIFKDAPDLGVKNDRDP